MEAIFKCWKITDESTTGIRIGTDAYASLPAAEEEIKAGALCLEKWYVERKYKTQVCTPDHPRPYYDIKSEIRSIRFEELIFKDSQCIGVCHDGLIMLFDDEKTHYREKYLGEMPTGHDQSITFYDYYYLHSVKDCQ
ncbi:MAG: hypothetical protein E7647_03995 [Ruminococcaceae bacterium]|nr:hypothetical protein [Oscillospiraceae bacterium]